MAAGEARKVTKTLRKYLEDDRKKYGSGDNSTVMDDVLDYHTFRHYENI